MGWTGQAAVEQRERLREYVRGQREKPCADCGTQYPHYVMEFDHARGQKDTDIAKMVRAPVGLPRLLKELAKCDLVCANCHRRRTYERNSEPPG